MVALKATADIYSMFHQPPFVLKIALCWTVITGSPSMGVTPHVPRFVGPQTEPPAETPAVPDHVACVVNIYGANDFTKPYGRSKDAHEVLPLGSAEQAIIEFLDARLKP